MLSIASDKIDSLFELIGTKQPLYIPVDVTTGNGSSASTQAFFKKWEKHK